MSSDNSSVSIAISQGDYNRRISIFLDLLLKNELLKQVRSELTIVMPNIKTMSEKIILNVH